MSSIKRLGERVVYRVVSVRALGELLWSLPNQVGKVSIDTHDELDDGRSIVYYITAYRKAKDGE